MSSKARNYTAAPVAKGISRAEARRRTRQKYARNTLTLWPRVAGVVGLTAVALLVALSFIGPGRGKLAAQTSSYAFGDVPWKGGYVTTKFAITVEGDTTVNNIVST